MLLVLLGVGLFLALVPALVYLNNLRYYLPPPPMRDGTFPALSVLIPARNETNNIQELLATLLRNEAVDLEVIVYDDNSEDDTAAQVLAVAATDPRVRLLSGEPLPSGWAGKQHACAVLARHARHPLLVFLDADVRLEPTALVRLAAFMKETGVDLASGVPRQETRSLLEKLLIPLIHFVLLGFLPLGLMRRSTHPSYGAGCGQLFLARREAYLRAGGHEAIRASFHDGLQLPRAFRRAGFRTDLFDATPLAHCRMYTGPRDVWNGLAKNAHEGLGSRGMIVPASLLLLGGQVMPFLLLPFCAGDVLAMCLAGAAVGFAYLPRILGIVRFRQSSLGALLHPIGILLLVGIQWYSLGCHLTGATPRWKGRTQATFISQVPS